MKFIKFKIEKYKALKDVEISFKNNLIPIIGINESGKSSLLHAILSFDRYNDTHLDGYHLEAKNRYDYDSTNHIITAYLKFDSSSEIKYLQKELSFAKSNKVLKQIEDLAKKEEPIILSRNLDSKIYSLDNIKTDAATAEKVIDFILTNLPYILFFDDFNDRVPDAISFPDNYLNDDYNEETDPERSEWNEYIEEIFSRASNDDLKSFLKNDNKKDRDGILSDVNDTLNGDIIQNWKKLKVLKRELNNENINDLELRLNYEVDESKSHVFVFNVIDKNRNRKQRYFAVTERSKGFQWFFNFAIKLKYNPKYVEEYDGAIYLLDEPGSYLHSSAQEELLKSLKEISETNKVIYCTHSQYLLNPDVINLSNIKIATREDGIIQFQNFGEYEETNKNKGALSPLYDALHLNLAKHSFPRNEKVIITEGIVDYYVISLIRKYHNILNLTGLQIIPGAGADNLKELISLSIAWAEKYTVLLDSDEKGAIAFKRYEKFFGLEESSKWILYSKDNQKENVEIEDFFSNEDQNNIKKKYSKNSLKKGISILFHSDEKEKNSFITSLSAETIKNFRELEKSIASKL